MDYFKVKKRIKGKKILWLDKKDNNDIKRQCPRDILQYQMLDPPFP